MATVLRQGFNPDNLLMEGVNALPLLAFLALNMRVAWQTFLRYDSAGVRE